jgi:hypothetical protein
MATLRYRVVCLDRALDDGDPPASLAEAGHRARSRLPASLTVVTRRANSAKVWRSRMLARLSLYDTLLERLPLHLQDVAAELGQLIQEEHTIEARKTSPCRGKGPALIVCTGWRHGGTTPRWRRV